MPTHFEDLPREENCRHPEHEPSNMIVIPPGKKMVHVCPACGKRTEVIPNQVRFYA